MKIDAMYQNLITCPYCGWKDDNTWECGMDNEDIETRECEECENDFQVECLVYREFSSAKMPGGTE